MPIGHIQSQTERTNDLRLLCSDGVDCGAWGISEEYFKRIHLAIGMVFYFVIVLAETAVLPEKMLG